MPNPAVARYRKVQLESAPPGRLLLERFDRLHADLAASRRAVAARDIPARGRAVGSALALLRQLEAAVGHGLGPELGHDRAEAYGRVRHHLLLGSLLLDPAHVDEAERRLHPVSDAFRRAILGSVGAPARG